MIEPTGLAQQHAWRVRTLPPVERVRPGLWSIPVPVADRPIRWTSCYAFQTSAGTALVDPGWPDDAAWDALCAGLRQAGTRIEDVHLVLATHAHPDHLGLGERIRSHTGARLAVHQADVGYLDARRAVTRQQLYGWLRSRGVPAVARDIVEVRAAGWSAQPQPTPDWELHGGERVLGAEWEVRAVWTPGHTPGHVCFYDRRNRLLLSGDHVLPRITSHVSAGPAERDDGLIQYQNSLRTVGGLDVVEVLPAHEYRFAGLADRVAELAAHHEQRAGEIVSMLAGQPRLSTWAVVERLTWSRPWESAGPRTQLLALTETYAHLMALQRAGSVVNRPDDSAHDAWSAC